MDEEGLINKFLNSIARQYGGSLARQFERLYIAKEKEITRLNKEIIRLNNIIQRKIAQYIQKEYGMMGVTYYCDFLERIEKEENDKN